MRAFPCNTRRECTVPHVVHGPQLPFRAPCPVPQRSEFGTRQQAGIGRHHNIANRPQHKPPGLEQPRAASCRSWQARAGGGAVAAPAGLHRFGVQNVIGMRTRTRISYVLRLVKLCLDPNSHWRTERAAHGRGERAIEGGAVVGPAKRGITGDCTPFLLVLQGMPLQLQGIALSPC